MKIYDYYGYIILIFVEIYDMGKRKRNVKRRLGGEDEIWK